MPCAGLGGVVHDFSQPMPAHAGIFLRNLLEEPNNEGNYISPRLLFGLISKYGLTNGMTTWQWTIYFLLATTGCISELHYTLVPDGHFENLQVLNIDDGWNLLRSTSAPHTGGSRLESHGYTPQVLIFYLGSYPLVI